MPDGLHAGPQPVLPVSPEALAGFLSERVQAPVVLHETGLLAGGAVQHNWRLDVTVDGAPRTLVLRCGPDLPLPESRPKPFEFDLITRAWHAGVPVAEPLWCADSAGGGFFVSAHVEGDTDRDRLWQGSTNGTLVGDLGKALARVHVVAPGRDDVVERPHDRVGTLWSWADDLVDVPGGVRSGLDWLNANTPAPAGQSLVHRDFRTGNFLVRDRRLAAILDWEFAGWGDPAEDIGWLCARCWRGPHADREAGGLGPRADFLDAYRSAGGPDAGAGRVRFWEVFAHVRWALIALQQGARARAGAWPAQELREAASRVPELAADIEADVARLTA